MNMTVRPAWCVCAITVLGLGLCPALAQTAAPDSPAAAKPESTVVLSPFEVKANKDHGYGATESLGATRVALANTDISSAIISLNEQVIADRGAVNAMEVLTLVSGVQTDSDGQPGTELFSLRGYSTGNISLRDGLPDPMNAADLPLGNDTSSYSRIEVIKGPAGVLYGSHSMGGVVNKVSKWPLFTAATKVELQAESADEFVRAAVDSTGPLSENLAYRVTLSEKKGQRYYDESDAPNDQTDITASLLRRVANGQGKLWFRGEYMRFNLDRENGWQFITGFVDPKNPTYAPEITTNGQYPVARTANTVPEDDISIGDAYALELGSETNFSGLLDGDWTLRVIGRYSDREGDKNPSYAQGRPVPVDASGAIVKYTNAAGAQVNSDNRFTAADDPRVADWRATLVLRDFRGYNENYVVNADMTGDFLTGPLHHKTVFSMGLTGGEAERAFFFWNATNPANTTAVANSFSAVQKTPENVTAESIKASGATKQFNNLSGYSSGWNFSTSALDNVSFWKDRIIASVGWRYDNSHSEGGAFDAAKSLAADDLVLNQATLTKTSNSQNTFRYGLVGKPLKGLSVFGQISNTFVPVSGLNALTGEPLKNRDGKNREIGLKVDLLGGRVTGTVSYFDSQLTNVLVPVALPIEQGGGTYNLPVGSQNSFGWEMDLAAEPVRGLTLMAGYSDVTSRDERGFAFRGVPIKPSYSLMARYSFAADSALKGFYLGAAMKHRGASPGDTTRTFYVGDGDQYDAFAGYGRGRWGVQLNVLNLTDSDTAWSAVSDQLVVRLVPRSYRLTLRYTF